MSEVRITVNGVAHAINVDDVYHPCQRAWTEEDVAQCGYCQAGMFFATGKRIRKLPIHAKDLA